MFSLQHSDRTHTHTNAVKLRLFYNLLKIHLIPGSDRYWYRIVLTEWKIQKNTIGRIVLCSSLSNTVHWCEHSHTAYVVKHVANVFDCRQCVALIQQPYWYERRICVSTRTISISNYICRNWTNKNNKYEMFNDYYSSILVRSRRPLFVVRVKINLLGCVVIYLLGCVRCIYRRSEMTWDERRELKWMHPCYTLQFSHRNSQLRSILILSIKKRI